MNEPAVEREGDISREKRKVFVRRDVKGYLVFFGAMLAVALVVVCILTLIPGRNPGLRTDGENGLGRSFAFPFTFYDAGGNLFVLENAESDPVPVDDSVNSALHHASKAKIYYLRENTLYEYDIASKKRAPVASDAASYSISPDASFIVYSRPDGAVCYASGNKSVVLSGSSETDPGNSYVIGKNVVLFVRECDVASGTAELCTYTSGGGTKLIAEGISYMEGFGIASGDRNIFYRRGGVLYVTDAAGNIIAEAGGALPVPATKQAMLYEPTTRVRNLDGNTSVRFLFNETGRNADETAPATNSAVSAGSLSYFDGKNVLPLAGELKRVIYCAPDHSFLLYSIPEGGGERVFRAGKNGKKEQLLLLEDVSKMLFDSNSDNLYFQKSSGALYRFNVYSVKNEPQLVSESSAMLYKYPEKPFIMFTVPESGLIGLVHSSNSVQQFDSGSELRLYGINEDKYLLLRSYGYGRISLDMAESEYLTRISQDIGADVFFDGKLETVIYNSGSDLFITSGGKTRCLGQYEKIRAADVA